MPPPHHRLAAYSRALEAVVALTPVIDAIPPSRSDLRDQLRRASNSIVLNLAEGAAELSPAEKARFYRFSRRSANECIAILDLLDRTVKGTSSTHAAREELERSMALTWSLLRSLEAKGRKGAESQPQSF